VDSHAKPPTERRQRPMDALFVSYLAGLIFNA
jgi:hypothetical protein